MGMDFASMKQAKENAINKMNNMSINEGEMEEHLKRLVKELKECDGQRNKLQKQINGYEAELAELRDRGSSMSKERSELRKEMDILKETLESEEAKRIQLESKMKTRENEHIQEIAEVRNELQNEVEKFTKEKTRCLQAIED